MNSTLSLTYQLDCLIKSQEERKTLKQLVEVLKQAHIIDSYLFKTDIPYKNVMDP